MPMIRTLERLLKAPLARRTLDGFDYDAQPSGDEAPRFAAGATRSKVGGSRSFTSNKPVSTSRRPGRPANTARQPMFKRKRQNVYGRRTPLSRKGEFAPKV